MFSVKANRFICISLSITQFVNMVVKNSGLLPEGSKTVGRYDHSLKIKNHSKHHRMQKRQEIILQFCVSNTWLIVIHVEVECIGIS